MNKEITLGKKTVGLNHKPYFVADIAANHDGELNRAKDLVWLAKEAGADCAKFQHFLAEKIVNDKEFKKLESLETHQSSWKKPVSEIYDQYHFSVFIFLLENGADIDAHEIHGLFGGTALLFAAEAQNAKMVKFI